MSTEQKQPTMTDLMKRIDELEQKLAPPPKPDMNQLLRQQIAATRAKTTITGHFDAHDITVKGS